MPEQRTNNGTIIAIGRTGSDAGVAGSGIPGMGNSPFRGPDAMHTGTGAGRVAER